MLAWQVKSPGVHGLLFVAFCAGGCGSTATPEAPSATDASLQRVGGAYIHATQKLGRPPKDRKELVPFFDPKIPAAEIFRSPDDGEDFEIVWGVDLRQLKATGNDVPVVAYEKRGKDGKRHVLRGSAQTSVMSEGELKSAKFPDNYKFPF
jgi:hypothetical protein